MSQAETVTITPKMSRKIKLRRTGCTLCTLPTGRTLPAFFTLLFIFAGCSTLQQDRMLDAVGETEFSQLDDIENALIVLRKKILDNAGNVSGDILNDLGDLRSRGEALMADESANRQFTARLSALLGIEARLSGNTRRAERRLQAARENWKSDETALLLEALLIKDPEDRLAFLVSQTSSPADRPRLESERGASLFALGRYGEALAAWDASLPLLPPAYSELYADRREKSWALKDSSDQLDSRSVSLITDQVLIITSMVELTARESELLKGIKDGRSLEGAELFAYLTTEGYLSSDTREDSPSRRRDAAQFLWRLLSDKTRDPAMLTRFSSRFRGRSSPIDDISVDDPWFDGALGCVQSEIMSLPDGVRFYPNQTITGIDFITWLESTAAF